jgi:hypothetical protein
MARTFRVTLKYPDGTTMFMGTVLAEEIIEVPTRDSRSQNGHAQTDTGERMTGPQRNYLFRLLAGQGLSSKDAEAHLKQYFEVDKLSDISKARASTYIDQLAKDQKDAHA